MKRLLAAVSSLAILCASPAFAATLPATPATVWVVMGSAQPGDVVQLDGGVYGALNLWGFKKAAPGVVVQPATGVKPSITTLAVDGSTNVTYRGLEIQMAPATQYGISVGGGSNLVFDGVHIHQADNATLAGVGLFLRNASAITFQNGEIDHLGAGASIVDSDHVVITNGLFHNIGVDGIDLAGSSVVTVSNNLLRDFGSPNDGDHPDAIQFWGTALHPVPDQLTITGNEYDRNAGTIAQGIFGGPATNVTVSNNALRGSMYNGISFAGVKGGTISGNFVQGYPDMGTQIVIRGASDSIKVLGNATQGYFDYAADGANTNITVSGTVTIAPASSPTDAIAYNVWKATQTTVATPPPVVTPPVVNPLQATVDSLNAQVASLNAQIASLTSQLQTAGATNGAQAGQVATLKAQLATAQASLTAATAKITKAKADLN